MQVILLENVANLGELGERVNVKSGYGRNFLIPQHKAVPATAGNVEAFEERRAELQGAADEKLALAKSCTLDGVNAVQSTATGVTGPSSSSSSSATTGTTTKLPTTRTSAKAMSHLLMRNIVISDIF